MIVHRLMQSSVLDYQRTRFFTLITFSDYHYYQTTENLSTTCCVGGHGRDEASTVGIYNWIAEAAVHMQYGLFERGSRLSKVP